MCLRILAGLVMAQEPVFGTDKLEYLVDCEEEFSGADVTKNLLKENSHGFKAKSKPTLFFIHGWVSVE